MCIAIPMTVVSAEGFEAVVERDGKQQKVTAELEQGLQPGDHVLVFRGSILRKMDAYEAEEVNKALMSLSAVMAGEATPEIIEEGFGDLNEGPKLPPHLQAMVGKKPENMNG
jgi:hydrogenase expression/formation protein HypC